MRQILSAEGQRLADGGPDLPQLRSMYRSMVWARFFDRKGVSLQKQGRLATYAPYEGQEACQIGSVSALAPYDWLVASYRDGAAMATHGYPPELLLAGRMGDERGGCPPAGVNVLPPSITVGGHLLHAVGLAWAERYRGRQQVALTLFGDGATSEGDFHEALNMAGVFRAPVVFFCQNNGYAISTPLALQTAAAAIADKAVGYGMEGIQVDGNDLLAVYAVTAQAVDRARTGEGSTLIEALTYRLGPHTTSDNPDRYRDRDETEAWRQRDPLHRVREYLTIQGFWSDHEQEELLQEVEQSVNQAVMRAESLPSPKPDHMFSAMFAHTPPRLDEQLAQNSER